LSPATVIGPPQLWGVNLLFHDPGAAAGSGRDILERFLVDARTLSSLRYE